MAMTKKPVGKVRKTQAQIDAELAASRKAFEKYRATLPPKGKRAEIINAQQARINRSKTVAPPAPTSTTRRPTMPNTTTRAPGKMTPQDSAMKKILEKKYGKIYG